MSGRLDELIPTAKEIPSSPRHDVQGDRLEACPMGHHPFRRQAASTAQLDRPHPEDNSLEESFRSDCPSDPTRVAMMTEPPRDDIRRGTMLSRQAAIAGARPERRLLLQRVRRHLAAGAPSFFDE